MKSIQTKFIVLILGCVMASSITIGLVGIYYAKNTVDENSIRTMNLLCSEKIQVIDALLSRNEQSVNTVSSYAIEQLDDVNKLQNDKAYMEEYTKKIKDTAINAANNTDGGLNVYMRFNPEFAEPTSGFFWGRTSTKSKFEEFTPTDFSKYSPEDEEHVGWYYIPIKSGKPTWLKPYYNQNVNVEMISYVIPIYVDNVTVGVIGIDIDFDVIRKIVDNISVYSNGYAFLVDEYANIMHHKQLSNNISIANLSESLKIIANKFDNSDNGNHLLSYEWENVQRKLSFGSIRNGMKLAITVPNKEINYDRNILVYQIIAGMIIISFISVLLTMLLTRHLIRPLKELNEAAMKIAGGDFSISLKNKTNDEVGMLTESFEKTVSHLQEYISYINGLAYRDGLTGVKNKTAYQETVDRINEQVKLGKPMFAVVVFDINNLKIVNDVMGHDFGDMLIINACKAICNTFKRSPVYRVGGDEFVTILENRDFEEYIMLFNKLQIEIDRVNQEKEMNTKLSIAKGIAIYDDTIDICFSDVFKRADYAMYQNKVKMKNKNTEI